MVSGRHNKWETRPPPRIEHTVKVSAFLSRDTEMHRGRMIYDDMNSNDNSEGCLALSVCVNRAALKVLQTFMVPRGNQRTSVISRLLDGPTQNLVQIISFPSEPQRASQEFLSEMMWRRTTTKRQGNKQQTNEWSMKCLHIHLPWHKASFPQYIPRLTLLTAL